MEIRINKYYLFLIFLLLTLISHQIISERSITNNELLRIEIQESILSGNMEPPYQYRIMEPLSGYILEPVVSVFAHNKVTRHVYSHKIALFITLFGIFFFMYKYLSLFFSDIISLFGLFLLQILIPLGITSIWESGDYFNLLFFLIALMLIFKRKEKYIPFLIAIATLNRDQSVFITVILAAFLYDRKVLFEKKNILLIIACVAGYAVAYFSMRLYFGFKINPYTISHETSTNITHWFSIAMLWSKQVFIYVIFSILAFKKSPVFFKWSFISLFVYVVFFFFNSIMSQLAKFLPAYLIMIPMTLQLLSGERMKYFAADSTDKTKPAA
ncbi:MAG TPA: hypothetical protein PK536_01315 [Ignavibacteria bacterium]|nr:hypothetical protein [Ignavibacteria bacterium]HRK00391.1 hypothetical protein [Ignavibacteria bacterium]